MNDELDDILYEWSYRVHNGMPNKQNKTHMEILAGVLQDRGWSHSVTSKFISNMRNEEYDDDELDDLAEDTLVRSKKSGSVYTVKNPNPKKHDIIKKDISPEATEKAKEKFGDEKAPTERSSKMSDDEVLRELGFDEKTLTHSEEEVTQAGLDYGEYKDNPIFKKGYDELRSRSSEFVDTLEDAETKIRNVADNTANVLNLAPEGTVLEYKSTNSILTTATGRKSSVFNLNVPHGHDRIAVLANIGKVLEEQGAKVVFSTGRRAGKDISVTLPSGEQLKYQAKDLPKPGTGKTPTKKPGQSHAYEALSAVRMALVTGDYSEDDVDAIISSLRHTGKFTTDDGTRIEATNISSKGIAWLADPANGPTASRLLTELLNKPDLDAMSAMAKSSITAGIKSGKFPPGTSMEVVCEGGEDTDEFRADVFVYAVTPAGEKVVILGNSVKDGSNNQLGQLGQALFRDAVELTAPNSPERIKALKSPKLLQQISKLPKGVQVGILESLKSLDDSTKMGEMYSQSLLKSFQSNPSALYEFGVFNLIGTGPYPDDLEGYFYQNKDKLYGIPMPGSDEGKAIQSKVEKLIKSGKIGISAGKPDTMVYFTNDGRELPLFRNRAKVEGGKLTRMLFEKKGGNDGVFLKILTDPNFEIK